jgi:hypothetical protein
LWSLLAIPGIERHASERLLLKFPEVQFFYVMIDQVCLICTTALSFSQSGREKLESHFSKPVTRPPATGSLQHLFLGLLGSILEIFAVRTLHVGFGLDHPGAFLLLSSRVCSGARDSSKKRRPEVVRRSGKASGPEFEQSRLCLAEQSRAVAFSQPQTLQRFAVSE